MLLRGVRTGDHKWFAPHGFRLWITIRKECDCIRIRTPGRELLYSVRSQAEDMERAELCIPGLLLGTATTLDETRQGHIATPQALKASGEPDIFSNIGTSPWPIRQLEHTKDS